jgi:SAM-dependent methyltransferase
MDKGKRLLSSAVGMRDWKSDGWFNGQTGEIARGVPISPGQTVIDVGCGDSGFIGFVAQQGPEVILVDQDAARLASAEARVRASPARACRAIQSDCDPIPLPDDAGDLVICSEVLEHVPDPVKFLQEVIRLARPGAQLLISVPDARSEQFVSTTAPPQYFQEPNHVRVYTAQAFEALIPDSALAIGAGPPGRPQDPRGPEPVTAKVANHRGAQTRVTATTHSSHRAFPIRYTYNRAILQQGLDQE